MIIFKKASGAKGARSVRGPKGARGPCGRQADKGKITPAARCAELRTHTIGVRTKSSLILITYIAFHCTDAHPVFFRAPARAGALGIPNPLFKTEIKRRMENNKETRLKTGAFEVGK